MVGVHTVLLASALVVVLALGAVCVLFVYKERRRYERHHRLAQSDVADHHSGEPTVTIGVLHPYADGGGGGERVMYCVLLALVQHFEQRKNKQQARSGASPPRRVELLLYAGDDGHTAKQLLERAAERFNLPALLECRVDLFVRLVPLANRHVLDPALYPRFTLFWQSIAHVQLALEAFRTSEALGLYPELWVDTTGCAFSYLVAKLRFGCTVVAYVHYPMISTDMIAKVQTRAADYNNNAAVATSAPRSLAKYVYYRLFAAAYALVGKFCTDVVLVNSTWTFNHIATLWGRSGSSTPTIVYPPCGSMAAFRAFSIDKRARVALSIAQFRPEKNQLLQLEALQKLLQTHATAMATTYKEFKLVMLGSCRNADDVARVEMLKEQSVELGVASRVEFVVNASFADLQQHLATASIGLHTMFNEHFGISIVEMMAAGLVVIANNSGGPAADIVKDDTGYLALTADEYAARMFEVLEADAASVTAMRVRARESADRFSDDAFSAQFLAAVKHVVSPASRVSSSDKST